MSFIKLWIHTVWSTYNREPYLIDNVRYKVFEHIKENAKKKDIYVDCINGYVDHVHCLISLNSEQSISKVMQNIKGESSFWINKELKLKNFGWQYDYFAVSISES